MQNKLWSGWLEGIYPVAVTGDFKKAFVQVRVAPEERNALVFHCLKNLDTRKVDT